MTVSRGISALSALTRTRNGIIIFEMEGFWMINIKKIDKVCELLKNIIDAWE